MASRARGPQRPQTQTAAVAKSAEAALPLEARIRQRAHEIYLERGGADGSEMDDWLQAEQEILASRPEGK